MHQKKCLKEIAANYGWPCNASYQEATFMDSLRLGLSCVECRVNPALARMGWTQICKVEFAQQTF